MALFHDLKKFNDSYFSDDNLDNYDIDEIEGNTVLLINNIFIFQRLNFIKYYKFYNKRLKRYLRRTNKLCKDCLHRIKDFN